MGRRSRPEFVLTGCGVLFARAKRRYYMPSRETVEQEVKKREAPGYSSAKQKPPEAQAVEFKSKPNSLVEQGKDPVADVSMHYRDSLAPAYSIQTLAPAAGCAQGPSADADSG
jgi:hypothetical protein